MAPYLSPDLPDVNSSERKPQAYPPFLLGNLSPSSSLASLSALLHCPAILRQCLVVRTLAFGARRPVFEPQQREPCDLRQVTSPSPWLTHMLT